MKRVFVFLLVLLVSMTAMSAFAANVAGVEERDSEITAIPSFRAVMNSNVYANADLTGLLYSVTKGTGLSGNTSNWTYSNGSIYVSRNGVSGYIAKKSIAPTAKLKTVITADYLYTGANGADLAYGSKVPVGTYGYYMGSSTIGSTTWFNLRVYIGSSTYIGWMKASNVQSAS